MYGDIAAELIRDITRDNVILIPKYQSELVDKIMKETDELYLENLKTSQTATRPNQIDEQPRPDANVQQDDDSQDSDNGGQDNIDIAEKDIMVMQVRHTAKLWNKRCIIAYHHERLKRLKQLRWEYGNNLPRKIVENLSRNEMEWFTRYNDNLFSYMSSLNDGRGLDLTLYLKPPKKLYIQVKCVKDYGQLDLEDGQPVMLKKDSIHYLPLSQCEKLIHQGVLEQTSL